MAYIPAKLSVAVPNLTGSVLSCIASFCALGLHVLVPPKRRHFRHALIINLLIADFINSLNNTISGILVLQDGYKDPKVPADGQCLANAWVGQFSVQAIDFNILVISISVLLAVTRSHYLDESSRRMTVLVCLVPWVPGTITSFLGLGLNVYGPVSGNWCWITARHLGLRYALTHGWRILIFVATIAIYTFIYVRLRRLFRNIRLELSSSRRYATGTRPETQTDAMGQSDTQGILVTTTVASAYELQDQPKSTTNPTLMVEGHGKEEDPSAGFQTTSREPVDNGTQSSSGVSKPIGREPASPNLRKMLLLNGYPIAYIILWIPGMANRLAESVGTSPQWLNSLQACSQFVGLVNALTYGFTEQIQRAVKAWMRKRNFRNLDP
ncbi:hypothetical protein F66182_8194 [Fusarium sp. NRRL 66182]|nr:hypothetical protein F66182_8194 [Fusarium sp. NRRL 66182]